MIWVVGRRGYNMGVQKLDEGRQSTLERLLDEFGRSYVSSEEGARHLTSYPKVRESGRQNFEAILEAKEAGQDVTEAVLSKLLPHRDSATNRARGAWIHIAPAVAADVRTWFENAGFVETSDWPQVAAAIFDFVRRVAEDPDSLEQACQRFSDSEHSKGFQTGMLTPILSALAPDQFILINNKSRAVVNHFLDLKHSQRIADYPELNTAAHYLINRIQRPLLDLLPDGVTAQEGFDAFSHWLVALKGYRFGRAQAWKIAVVDSDAWSQWVEGGYAGLLRPVLFAAHGGAGLNEPALEDVSGTRKKDWEDIRARTVATHSEIAGERLDEVWSLAAGAQEGDLIVAVQGTDRVLGPPRG